MTTTDEALLWAREQAAPANVPPDRIAALVAAIKHHDDQTAALEAAYRAGQQSADERVKVLEAENARLRMVYTELRTIVATARATLGDA